MVPSESPILNSDTPRRVTTQINVPVRQQIAWAKALKRIQTQSKYCAELIIKSNKLGWNSKSFVKTKFRQDKAEKSIMEEYYEVDYHNTQPPGKLAG